MISPSLPQEWTWQKESWGAENPNVNINAPKWSSGIADPTDEMSQLVSVDPLIYFNYFELVKFTKNPAKIYKNLLAKRNEM